MTWPAADWGLTITSPAGWASAGPVAHASPAGPPKAATPHKKNVEKRIDPPPAWMPTYSPVHSLAPI